MWNVEPNKDESRGGFQDRDAGRSNFRDDFGPDYGIDFARFSDVPDVFEDQRLLETIRKELPAETETVKIFVRNGFIFLSGTAADEKLKENIARTVQSIPGVQYIINQLKVKMI